MNGTSSLLKDFQGSHLDYEGFPEATGRGGQHRRVLRLTRYWVVIPLHEGIGGRSECVRLGVGDFLFE